MRVRRARVRAREGEQMAEAAVVDFKKTDRDKLAKLVEALHDLRESTRAKEEAIIREMGRLASGQGSIGDDLKRLERHFQAVWGGDGRYVGEQYVWEYAADRAQWKRLLQSLSVEELERRVERYITSDDPFLVRNKHPFRLFVRTVNQYARVVESETLSADTVFDCQHQPRCRSDQAHTQRRAQELRA
jgi:hypothetical protein